MLLESLGSAVWRNKNCSEATNREFSVNFLVLLDYMPVFTCIPGNRSPHPRSIQKTHFSLNLLLFCLWIFRLYFHLMFLFCFCVTNFIVHLFERNMVHTYCRPNQEWEIWPSGLCWIMSSSFPNRWSFWFLGPGIQQHLEGNSFPN